MSDEIKSCNTSFFTLKTRTLEPHKLSMSFQMAAIQPFVNLQPFKGTEAETIEEFFRQLTSCMQAPAIPDANRHTYLHIQLKGGELAFFDQLLQTKVPSTKSTKL